MIVQLDKLLFNCRIGGEGGNIRMKDKVIEAALKLIIGNLGLHDKIAVMDYLVKSIKNDISKATQ